MVFTDEGTIMSADGVCLCRRHAQPNTSTLRKSDLSPARRRLVEGMQDLGFGRYKHLVIVNGDPLLNPAPRRYQDRRLTGPNRRCQEVHLADFALKEQVVHLFEEFDAIRNGVIAVLEVREGLPYNMTLEKPSQ